MLILLTIKVICTLVEAGERSTQGSIQATTLYFLDLMLWIFFKLFQKISSLSTFTAGRSLPHESLDVILQSALKTYTEGYLFIHLLGGLTA